jgi:DNA-directed RNA polymerase specialized sigma24 family protein
MGLPDTAATVIELLREVKLFVRILNVPNLLSDDVVSDVSLVLTRRSDLLATMTAAEGRSWVREVTALTLRNAQRGAFRRNNLSARLASELIIARATHDWSTSTYQLSEALKHLTDLDMALLVGQVLEGRSSRELSHSFGITELNVRQRLKRAKNAVGERLRQQLC